MKDFKYKGYSIPVELVMLTGGGVDDWSAISEDHKQMYKKYTPINPDDSVLEIGCGVGRDAIELTEMLSDNGKYLGIDIIKPSIDWARKNISKRHKNFKFHHIDIKSQIHNHAGVKKVTEVKLPVEDSSVDRIILHSVFTHMFKRDIIHYLKEFNRILKPDGLVLTSFFVLDKAAKDSLDKGNRSLGRHPLSFKYRYGVGCYINDKAYPEGAVAYSPSVLKRIVFNGGLKIRSNVVHRGSWSGIQNLSNGQDIVVLRKCTRAERLLAYGTDLSYSRR